MIQEQMRFAILGFSAIEFELSKLVGVNDVRVSDWFGSAQDRLIIDLSADLQGSKFSTLIAILTRTY